MNYRDFLEVFGLSQKNIKKCGKDLKIVPMYLHRKSNQIIIGQKVSYIELSENIKNHKAAAIFYMDKVNNLYKKIINKNL